MMKKLLREPLVHFAILGMLLFGYFYARSDASDVAPPPDQIIVTETDVSQLIQQYQAVWRRPPEPEELSGLIDSHVQEEVLVREALELGLDRDDAAIRNRLRQKMQFLMESAAQSLEPNDDLLQQHLQDNAEQFTIAARMSFQQVYLGETPEQDFVRDVQASLADGAAPETVGVRSLLPAGFPNATRSQVDGAFGSGFFATAQQLVPDQWQGPVRSGYGYHLVRVGKMVAPRLPDLQDVRDKVLLDWRRVQSNALAKAQVEILKSRYDIVTPDPDSVQGLLLQ